MKAEQRQIIEGLEAMLTDLEEAFAAIQDPCDGAVREYIARRATLLEQIKRASPRVSVKCVDKGFSGRYAEYRVAWSTSPVWDPDTDARSRKYKIAKSQGQAGVWYQAGNKQSVDCMYKAARQQAGV